MRIRIGCYRSRRTGDDPQARVVDVGPITIWFSYNTAVAFSVSGAPPVVRQNDWGPTTGRHLNEIDADKTSRISGKEFEEALEREVGKFFYPRDLDRNCPSEVVADWLEDRGLNRAAEAIRETELSNK